MKCKECGDTGKITLFTSVQPCEACRGINWFQMPIIKQQKPLKPIPLLADIFEKQVLSPGAQAKYPIDFSEEVCEEMERWKPRDHFTLPEGCEVPKADWGKYGKAAGPIRNQEIVNVSDIVIAFWNKKSRGTKDTIDKALRGNKPVLVIPFLEDK